MSYGRRNYSRRHYQMVSPPRETQAEILERAIQRRAAALAQADREAQFPELTSENAQAVIDYQADRIKFHAEKVRTQPNWRKSREDVERLVKGTCAWYPNDPKSEAYIAAVIERIVETGDGVWHAASHVTGTTCWCSPCCIARGEKPWSL